MDSLDAELITQTGEAIAPEYLDFITDSGLVVYDGKLFPLPKGAVWVVQLLESGAWFIAKEYLGEALYQLAHRIHDGEFLRHLSEVHCVQKTPLLVVYLRAKHFDKQMPVTLYLAYRYGDFEVFSLWHSQDETNITIGFESDSDTCILHFRDFASESTGLYTGSLYRSDASIQAGVFDGLVLVLKRFEPNLLPYVHS